MSTDYTWTVHGICLTTKIELPTFLFPQALLAGFSFRTGEYKAFAVRKIVAKPEKVPMLHKIVPGNLLGNLLGNVPDTFFGKKKSENPRYFFFLTF